MRRYPKFLSKSPSFLGLNLTDLVLMAVGLQVSLILGLSSLMGMIVTIALILGSKALRHYVDLTTWVLGFRPTKNLEWSEYMERGEQ